MRTIVESAVDHLRAQGFDVLKADGGGACSDSRCALQAAAHAQANLALQLSVFAKPLVSFSVSLVQAPNATFTKGVSSLEHVDDETLAHVTEHALDDVLSAYRRGPGPWLEVDGAPYEALVRLDGRPLGVMPVRARVTGGEHLVQIEAAGHDSFADTVWLESSAGAQKKLFVQLRPTARVVSPPAPSLSWLLTGAAAMVAGAGLVGAGTADLAHQQGKAVGATLTTLGGALVAFGLSTVTVTVLRGAHAGDPQEVTLRLARAF